MPDNWDASGEPDELDPRERALRHFEAELSEARSLGDSRREARAHAGLGLLYSDQGKLDAATHEFRECLLSARDGGDREGIAWSLYQLGRVHGQTGSLDDGLRFLSESITEWGDIRHSSGLLQAELLSSQYRAEVGHFAEALDLLTSALERARQSDEPDAECRALRLIAEIRAQQGQWGACAEAHRQCIPLLARQGNTREEAAAWVQLSTALFECYRYSEALEAVDRACALLLRCDDPRSRSSVLMSAATALAGAGRITQAEARLEQALEALAGIDDRLGLARMRLWAAELYAELARWPDALANASVAAELFREIGNLDQQCRALRLMAHVHESRGVPAQALALYEQAAELYLSAGLYHGEAVVRAMHGAAALAAGPTPDALEQCERAAHMLRTLQDDRQRARTLYTLGSAYHRIGDLQAARDRHLAFLRLAEEIGDVGGRDRALEALTQVAVDQGDLSEARDWNRQRIALAQRYDCPRSELSALWTLADLARRDESPEELIEAAQRIEQRARAVGNLPLAVDALEARMSTLMTLQRFDEAAEAISLWLQQAHGAAPSDIEHWMSGLAIARSGMGDYEGALATWDVVLPQLRQREAAEPLRAALRSAHHCYAALGRMSDAEAAAEELLSLARAGNDAHGVHEACLLLARYARRRRRYLRAWRLMRQARKAVS